MTLVRHVSLRLVGHLLLIWVALLGGWIALDLVAGLNEFLRGAHGGGIPLVLRFYLWHAPGWALQMLPLAAFLGALVTAGEMRQFGESEAVLLAGCTPLRLLHAVVAGAFVLGSLVSMARATVMPKVEREARILDLARTGRVGREDVLAVARDGTTAWTRTYRPDTGQAYQWVSLSPGRPGAFTSLQVAQSALAPAEGEGTWRFVGGTQFVWSAESPPLATPLETSALSIRSEDLGEAAQLRLPASPLDWRQGATARPSVRRAGLFAWIRLWTWPIELPALILIAWGLSAAPRRFSSRSAWIAGIGLLVGYAYLGQVLGVLAAAGAVPVHAAACVPLGILLILVARLRVRLMAGPLMYC